MMLNRKRPIRTYERKPAKKSFINPLSPVVFIKKYDPVYCFDGTGISNESLNNDPFETTFDRIAKGAVVPPIPVDTNENNSWKGYSSDSDVNNSSKASDLFKYDDLNTFSSVNCKLINRSNKVTRKKPLNKSKMVVYNGMISKKSPVIPKNKIQFGKKQERKRQKNKKKKIQSNSKKSSRMCNERTSHANSGDVNNLEDTCKNVFQYISKCQQKIKPCFVELDPCIVENYIMNCKKVMGAMQGTHSDVKFSDTDTSHIEKDISKGHGHNAISQSIEDNINVKSFKTMSMKECFVALYDNIKNQKLKTEESINSVDTKDKSNMLHLTLHNSSASCNTNILSYDIKRNNEELIKDSIVKMERLKMDEFIKKDNMACKERKSYIISSTPVRKCMKSLICSVLISPININTLHLKQESSISNVEKNISNIVSADQRNSSLIMPSKCSYDATDIYEYPTQLLSSSRKTQTLANRTVEIKVTSFSCEKEDDIHTAITQKDDIHTALTQKDDIHTAFTQKCNLKCKVVLESLPSLDVFSIADSDKSLFSDTDDYSSKNIEKCKVQKVHLMNKSTDVNIVNSFVDSCLERINNNSNTSVSPSEISMMEDFEDNIKHLEYDSAMQEKISVHENSKNETVNNDKSNFLCEDQNNINNSALLARLQDSIRITGKRMQYVKWNLSVQSNISEKSNEEVAESNSKIFHCKAMNETGNAKLEMNNFEHPKNAVKKSLDHVELLDYSTELCDDVDKQIEKPVFLKPGKHWARSLSILNRINDGSDLNKLSYGKGKRWRHSVRDILDMQKQGVFQSCLKKVKDDADLCKELDESNIVSSFDDNKRKTFNSANHVRFSKRISVRVVPNNTTTNISCKIEDTSFLEAFGIKSEKSLDLEQSLHKESPTRDSRIIKWHSTTARDVVLQRCSQNSYLSFSYCFPDSYLEHCRKIGEGVYGEVFLYEHLDKKSVIKIIPIEGEKLVNGESQKKFHEILSEIVIAKELDNLRLNTTYKTTGFVEVRSIKCIKGKYPKKLIELWKTYDDNKTSDNDCPSIFDKNQLYIALELCDGGEDLEAFVFQTAEEACALFLQTALALASAEKALEFEHRDLHWGNILISRTKEPYVCYNIDGKEIKLPSKGVKVSIIDFTLSRMLYQGCCIYNDLALDPALFTAYGEYQFEIYRLMRDKIQNNWNKYEPYTNILWLHYTLDKMITAVRYKKKNLKVHKRAIIRLKEFKDIILNYDSAFDFATDSNVAHL